MNIRLLFLLIALAVAGCGGLLTQETPAPVFYQLDYKPAEVSCGRSFGEGLRVWEFSTASPFDQSGMVATGPEQQVEISKNFQWVAKPGTMVAEQLARDLNAGGLFTMVQSGNSPVTVPLEMTGRVYQFAWQRGNDLSRAVLKVEVSLIDTRGARQVLFHQTYDLQSQAFPKGNSSTFAAAMSDLAAKFSEKLRRDLCQAIGNRQ